MWEARRHGPPLRPAVPGNWRATRPSVTRACAPTCVGAASCPPSPRARTSERVNPRFDKETYRQHNVIERCVGWLKENRQLATRYAKLAANYLATVKLAMIRRCLCLLADPSDRT